jgi:branched-chain amino acid transport system ATP-binding protein
MTDILRTEALSVHYGGVQALCDVDLAVGEGQLIGLIGPNGAGKTTFIDAVSGFARAQGRVTLGGEDISSLAPHRRARRGLARTWQAAELFDDLSVRENLRVACSRTSLWRAAGEVFMARERELDSVERALALVGLDKLADRGADELAQGQRKLVDVARALAAEPTVLFLDEPAAGLDSVESQAFGRHLRTVVDGGTAVVLIDHDMGLVLTVCDHVVVLDFGKVIARGRPDEVRSDAKVVEAYLGASAIAAETT